MQSRRRRPVWSPKTYLSQFNDYWIMPIRDHTRRRHWFFNLVQLAGVVLAIYWWNNLPVPGYAIGVLAVLAAVMTVHGEMRNGHKIIWMLLIGVFLIVEFRAISKDREDFARREACRRKEENQQFQTITNTLISQFLQTMARFDENVNMLTGGDSFTDVKLNPTRDGFHITNEGNYALSGLHVLVIDYAHGTSRNLEIPSIAPHFGIGLGYFHNFLDVNDHDFGIISTAINGAWMETFQTRIVDGKLTVALKVERIVLKFRKGEKRQAESVELSPLLEQVDSTYPRSSNNKVEWRQIWSTPGGVVKPH